jgi:hypothetical protein
MRTITKLVLAAFASGMLLSSATASSVVRRYPLPDRGQLVLSVPDNWNEEIESPQPGASKALWFTPRSGASFNVLITPITAPTPDNTVPDDVAIRRMVSSSAKKTGIPIHRERTPDQGAGRSQLPRLLLHSD